MSPFRLLLILGITLLLLSAMFVGSRSVRQTDGDIAPMPSISQGLSDNKNLNDSNNSYSFTVPDTFIVEENGMYSKIIRKQSGQLGAGPTNFAYISTVIKGKEGEEGSIYSYYPQDFQMLIRMQPGESKAMGDRVQSTMLEYVTYTRIEDRMVGGYGAKGFKNTKPWEFPAGTVEYRYIVETEPVHYIVGAYVGGDQNEYLLTEADMDTIFSGLRLTPDAVVGAPVSLPADWKQYVNAEEGISFQYPGNWKEDSAEQNFQDGDLFGLVFIGNTQRTQTEFTDGVRVSVMKPIPAGGKTALAWAKSRYDAVQNPEIDTKPEYSTVTFGSVQYDRIYVCGLGCFSYYYTVQQGKIYGFMFFGAGPNEEQYTVLFKQMMESVVYSQ